MPAINVRPVVDVDDLYRHYQGQTEQQPVRLCLGIDRGEANELWCEYNPEIGGGVPASIWHGQVRAFGIPCLTAEAANALLADVTELAQRVVDDSEVVWDGNNWVGRYGDDAEAASDQIAARCADENFDEQDLVTGYDVATWFADGDDNVRDSMGITADTTDAEMAELAAQQVREAATTGPYGYVVLDGDAVLGYLVEVRDELREERADVS